MYIKVEVLKAFNLKLKLEFLKNVLKALFKFTSYFKKFLIIFINVIIIDFSFYFKSLFNNIKLFKSSFL